MSKSSTSIRTPAAKVRGLGAAKSGTEHFWLTRVTAVANIALTFAFVIIVLMLSKADYAGAKAIEHASRKLHISFQDFVIQ